MASGSPTTSPDGSYEYFNTNEGRTAKAKYSVMGGQVCVVFTNGQNRCDKIFKDDKGLYMLIGRASNTGRSSAKKPRAKRRNASKGAAFHVQA